MEKYIYNPDSEEIEGIKGGVLYDSCSLEDMTIPARQRLAELASEDNERDWMACWKILAAEGLYPGPEPYLARYDYAGDMRAEDVQGF